MHNSLHFEYYNNYLQESHATVSLVTWCSMDYLTSNVQNMSWEFDEYCSSVGLSQDRAVQGLINR